MLVERRSQIGSLDGIYQQCRAGRGGISQIVGPVASGKTELLRVFAEQLSRDGATVLEATGSAHESELAFGILRQLFAGLPDAADRCRVQRLLDESASRPAGGGTRFLRSDVNQELWATVRRLAERTPVALIVDDLHHADLASLRSLLYFGGRLRTAPVVIVAAQTELPLSVDLERAVAATELLRQPRFRLLRVEPLTPDGVRQLLTEQAGVPVRPETARSWHRLTGGSPFLLRALIEDNAPADRGWDEPIAGEEFAKAALACLHRGGRQFLEVARALAVLAATDSPALLARFLNQDESVTAGIVAALGAAGLLDGPRFRHPATRSVVLSELSSPGRAELHRRAAELLYDHGAEPYAVGVHLVAADRVSGRWALEALTAAAREALQRDDLEFAAHCLRLAETGAGDGGHRLEVDILRVHVESRRKPENSTGSVATVLDAVDEGRVDAGRMIGLLRPLLWQGRAAAAAAILGRLELAADDLDDGAAADLSSVRVWMRCTHPGLLAGLGARAALSGGAQVAVVANRSVRGPALLADVLEAGPTEHTVPTAEWLLQTTRLTSASLNSVIGALLALVHADRVDLADGWCESLLREAVARAAPTWQAALLTARAEIAIRRGDMAAARRDGLAALTLMPRNAFGVAIGAVMAKILLAATALGDWQTADECLTAMPDAVFETRYGVQFLYARGRRLLAADRLRAALDDLLTCGRLMAEWGIDQPTFVPWRAAAVEALLRSGDRPGAADLAAEQLERTTADQPRARGIALRSVAATRSDPADRAEVLHAAIECLEQSADRAELAYAIADLSQAQVLLGEPRRARQAAQRATRLAEQQSLEPLLRRLDLGRRPVEPVAGGAGQEPEGELLSAAERRVVTLAVGGHTNREIAAELFITVSTVEQHLTRVYRKLGIKGRGDLAAYLQSSGIGDRTIARGFDRLDGDVLGQRGAA